MSLDTYRPSASTRAVWLRQLEQMRASIERRGAVIECDDGFLGVDRTIMGEPFMRAYTTHLSVGFSLGWL